jgi:ParB family chromosome partitioning protein
VVENGDKHYEEKVVHRKIAGEDIESNFRHSGISKPVIKRKNETLSLDSLVPFADHPFKTYEGTRFHDMVESIRASGVISSIIVRPVGDKSDIYEILSGHNRVNAAREAGLKTIPALILSGLTEDEAKLIVTETNLYQRSFSDMAHSERAASLSMHYEAIKNTSGYRSDLLEEIDKLTCDPMGTRLRTRDKIGHQFSLGGTTVARYLRINKLIPELKERLDSDVIGIRVAEALSFLGVTEQDEIENSLASGAKISIAQAEKLREESGKGELSRDAIEQILPQNPVTTKSIKLNWKLFPDYFKKEQSAEEIKSVIAKVLEMYFSKDRVPPSQ